MKKLLKSPTSILFIIIISVIVIGNIYNRIVLGEDYDKDYKVEINYDGEDAYILSQSKIKEHLKSPKSSDFPSYFKINEGVSYLSENTYKIEAYVDSKNSFGVELRQKYSCVVFFDTKKGTYKVSNILFE